PVVGRGPAAISIVAYALGITSVEPLRYDLPFERFLSPARKDCPDIDVDIDWRGRDAVIEHAYDVYGADRVAMISTHVTFQARGALQAVAPVFGRSLPTDDRDVHRAAASIEGLPRHLSIHPGGIVIGDGPLADSLPLER